MSGKDLNRDPTSVSTDEVVEVKVSKGTKTEWYTATVMGIGMLSTLYKCTGVFVCSLGEKREMIMLQDGIEDDGDENTEIAAETSSGHCGLDYWIHRLS